MTAITYKTTLHQLIDEISDENTLGEAYLAIQVVLHPELLEQFDIEDFEAEIDERLQGSRSGDVINHEDMTTWINQLTK